MPVPGPASFIVVAPDGSITYEFSGHIQADGLDLYAGTIASPPADNKVRWVRQSDGSLVRETFATEYPGSIESEDKLHNPAHINNYTRLIQYLNSAGTQATIEVRARENSGVINNAVVLDSEGKSSFLQISAGTGQTRKSVVGRGNMTWPGGSQVSNTLTVNHGLNDPGYPLCIATATITDLGVTSVAISSPNKLDNNNLYLRGYALGSTPAAGQPCVVDYLIISES